MRLINFISHAFQILTDIFQIFRVQLVINIFIQVYILLRLRNFQCNIV